MAVFRLGLFQLNTDRTAELIEAIKRQPGSCDKVWLTTMGYYPTLEKHTQIAEEWMKPAKMFQDAGISVALHVANTIGHGDFSFAAPENGGEFGKGMLNSIDDPFMVGPNGEKNKSCFCWNSKGFRRYTKSVVKIYCERLHPERLWFDDDLRAHNHYPSQYGCYCERCIALFNAKYKSTFTRKTLVHEINYGNTEWRRKYIEFVKQGMYDFTYEIAHAAAETTEGLTFGYEYEHWGNYMGTDDFHVLKALYDASGKPVETRPGGSYYHDKAPWEQYVKAMVIAAANSLLPEYVQASVAEIEDLPGTVYGKSIGGIINEGTLDLAIGCTDISLTDVQSCHESMKYYEKIFAKISGVKPYWDRLSEISANCCRGGVNIYMGKQPHLRVISEDSEPFSWVPYMLESEIGWLKLGIPITYDRRNPSAYILNHNWVNSLTDEDISFLLTKPVIADGESIQKLIERGFGSYFALKPEPVGNGTMEIFTNNPINGSKSGQFYNENPYASVPMQRYIFHELDQTSEVLGKMYNESFVSDEAYLGPCTLITEIKNSNKAKPVKWMISGYSLWNDRISSGKRNQIVRALDEITTMPVTLVSEEQAVVIPSLSQTGETVSVSIAACSQSGTDDLQLIIRKPHGMRANVMTSRNRRINAEIKEHRDDEILVSISSLDPYEIMTIFLY